jgi:hypothetical protein
MNGALREDAMAEEVWILIRDDGNSQVAEETIDSVWSSEKAMKARRDALYEFEARPPLLTRYERWTVRDA